MQQNNSNARTTTYCLDGLCCAEEERAVRTALKHVDGVGDVNVNLIRRTITVAHTCRSSAIEQSLKSAGFPPRPEQSRQPQQSFLRRNARSIETASSGILLVAALLLDAPGRPEELVTGLCITATIIAGWRSAWKGVRAATRLRLDMNILMTVAAVSAIAIGKVEEAAAVMVLFSVSLLLEDLSIARSRASIGKLMDLTPPTAAVIRNGMEETLDVRNVNPGEHLLVRPGERIPLDGRIVSGSSSVDQSPITGESQPVRKGPEDLVFAGSINGRGAIQLEVLRPHGETMLAGIATMVNNAIEARAPIQRFVDRFARIYTPSVFIAAVLVALVPPLLFGGLFGEWFYKSLILLVIACPCALVISTPITIVSAISVAARRGVLVKGGDRLELLSRVTTMAFDKTGTLTEGRPQVTDILPLNGIGPENLLAVAAALEWKSEHPLADAVIRKAREEGVRYDHLNVSAFESMPGKGLRAKIGGEEWFIGNHALVEDRGLCSPDLEQTLHGLEAQSKSTLVIGNSTGVAGIIATADAERREASEALRGLRDAGVNTLILITGDNATTAERIGKSLGLDEVHAGVFPEGKLRQVEALQAAHGPIAMVGDGINDAPALAAAEIGIAMGTEGADVAAETADIVLQSGTLTRIPDLVRLSKTTLRIIRQNIAIALGTKLLFILLGLFGVSSLWMAVVADDGATLVVILNGFRLFWMDGGRPDGADTHRSPDGSETPA